MRTLLSNITSKDADHLRLVNPKRTLNQLYRVICWTRLLVHELTSVSCSTRRNLQQRWNPNCCRHWRLATRHSFRCTSSGEPRWWDCQVITVSTRGLYKYGVSFGWRNPPPLHCRVYSRFGGDSLKRRPSCYTLTTGQSSCEVRNCGRGDDMEWQSRRLIVVAIGRHREIAAHRASNALGGSRR